jgi:hypothetical protein
MMTMMNKKYRQVIITEDEKQIFYPMVEKEIEPIGRIDLTYNEMIPNVDEDDKLQHVFADAKGKLFVLIEE